MESIPAEKQLLISSFLEIAVGQSVDTAIQFLQATSWKLEEAIQLFYIGNEGNGAASPSVPPPIDDSPSPVENAVANDGVDQSIVGDEEVRAPLPVKRETLYGDASFARLHPSAVVAFRNFDEESRNPAVWESDQSAASTASGSQDNLASLYRPPFALMFQGPFEKAKVEASLQDKWLLVNLQSTEEFSSHMLNRDTWSNEAVAQTIRTNFIFWQVYHDTSEGKKVCTYYNLVSIPSILVIDPITGQKMRAWSGMVQPERLLEDLLLFMDKGPKEHHVVLPHKRPRQTVQPSQLNTQGSAALDNSPEEDDEFLRAVAASMEDTKEPIKSIATDDANKNDKVTVSSPKPAYPPLPDEPSGSRELLCKVGIRLPDGRRLQRTFLRTDPIKLLWSFCHTQVEGGETQPFSFTQAIPGASKKTLEYESNLTFAEAGLSGSMVSMTWV